MNASELSFDQRACFIAGQGKSGTTLLLSLLDGHPELLVFPEETAYFPTVLTKYGNCNRREQLDYLTSKSEARLLFSHEMRGGGGRDYSQFPVERFREKFETTAFIPENQNRDLLVLLMKAYADTMDRPETSIKYWIEKTPANRNYLDSILKKFPKAKILLTIRDPRGVMAARLKRERNKRQPRLSVYDNIRNWRVSAQNAIKFQNASENFFLVQFEKLLTEPMIWMEKICLFLGITYDPNLLVPTKAGRSWEGNSAVKTPFHEINTGPISRWKKELTEKEMGWVEMHCRDLMPLFGYDTVIPKTSFQHWIGKIQGETARSYLRARYKSAISSLLA